MKVTYLLKLFPGYEIVVLLVLLDFPEGPSGVANLLFKDALILLEDLLEQRIFSYSRWSDEDEGLSSQRRWVEWMEILFGIYEDIILKLVKRLEGFDG
jgi:hypothetical protein